MLGLLTFMRQLTSCGKHIFTLPAEELAVILPCTSRALRYTLPALLERSVLPPRVSAFTFTAPAEEERVKFVVARPSNFTLPADDFAFMSLISQFVRLILPAEERKWALLALCPSILMLPAEVLSFRSPFIPEVDRLPTLDVTFIGPKKFAGA